ncbi:MAG: IS110 family transposase [Rhodospirillales bacterium]|nr:MAG: IS110 family transposase [Rhodospirillales bacterium]
MAEHSTPVAGIDTGKTWLDIALWPDGATWRVPNTAEGHRALRERLAGLGVRRAGIEASGGYERAVAAALRGAGVEVAVLQPGQVRAFAAYKLRRAKNDRIDAALIAGCAAGLAGVRAAPDPRMAPLAEHLLFIEQIEDDLRQTRCRLERFAARRLRAGLERDVQRLERRRDAELALLLKTVRAEADLARRLDLVASVDGVGIRTALTLVVLMPELGALSREQAAALAGLAPFDRDSGTLRGERHIAGGRGRVRKALFNAALPAAFRWNDNLVPVYKTLVAKGKPHKKALVACARKLVIFVNAVLARGTPWTKQIPV